MRSWAVTQEVRAEMGLICNSPGEFVFFTTAVLLFWAWSYSSEMEEVKTDKEQTRSTGTTLWLGQQ